MGKITPHYSETRSILADVVPLLSPYSIQVEPSQLCNLKCKYCTQGLIKRESKRIMSMGTFLVLLNSLEELGHLKQFNFAGWGEPLTNPDLPWMVSCAKEFDIDNVAIITNGILLTPELTDHLLNAGVDHVRISLQGMSSAKYKEVGGREIDMDNLVDNIKYLYQNRRDCKVSVKIADISLDDGDRRRFFDTFVPITNSVWIESIRPMFKEYKQDGLAISKYGAPHPPVRVCPLPFFMMSVTATGDILPCCNYYDPAGMGNIWYTSLKEVWEGSLMKSFWQALLKGRAEQKEFKICRDCLMPDAVLTPGDELDEKADEIRGRL